MAVLSERALSTGADIETFFEFFSRYQKATESGEVIADLTFGNPHEMPLPGVVSALHTHIEPLDVDWFAYKTNEQEPCEVISASLRNETGLGFETEDIAMTRGAFGAIELAFALLTDPGDECIIPTPGWFFYSTMLVARNAVPVKVPLAPDTFDLDVDAIEAAITPRTRVVIVNTPHNPTGLIYSRERLQELADMLTRKSAENGRPIFILSDEPYRRIRFDGVGFTSPAEVYPYTLIDYSYGKVLLAPGLRLGYLAVCPTMPVEERQGLRDAFLPSQLALGWGVPDAPLQYAVGDLEKQSIDVAELQRKRDRLHAALTQWGYEMTKPAGTFYLWGAAPSGDSDAFARALSEKGVFVMPGSIFDRPGHFRICLTATSDMVEASLPAFQDMAGFRA